MTFIGTVIDDLKESESAGRLLTLPDVEGLSGDKLIGFLQRSALSASQVDGAAYLEIGVYQGLTLSSVSASAPRLNCFGIDDFSQFDPEGKNRSIVESRLAEHSHDNGFLINSDFEQALLNLDQHLPGKRIAVYFVDGPHDYRSQYLCLDFAKPYLADDVVIVVDDSNYEHVRRANGDWLKANPDFALLYDAYTPVHPGNLTGSELDAARAGWWNGVNVIVRDPRQELSRMYPPVSSSRERYFNDHQVHAHRYSELVPQLLSATRAPFIKGVIDFLREGRRRPELSGRFVEMNTYSEKLEIQRLAEFRQRS